MGDIYKLNELRGLFETFTYPVTKTELAEDTAEVTLQYADGEEALSAVVDRLANETFDSVDELEAEVYANLPVEAVGEPGQAEGEG